MKFGGPRVKTLSTFYNKERQRLDQRFLIIRRYGLEMMIHKSNDFTLDSTVGTY